MLFSPAYSVRRPTGWYRYRKFHPLLFLTWKCSCYQHVLSCYLFSLLSFSLRRCLSQLTLSRFFYFYSTFYYNSKCLNVYPQYLFRHTHICNALILFTPSLQVIRATAVLVSVGNIIVLTKNSVVLIVILVPYIRLYKKPWLFRASMVRCRRIPLDVSINVEAR